MLRIGHMGLTGGLASAASAIWIRKKTLPLLEHSSKADSLRSRLRRRGKYALAGIVFTGSATAVSGGLDAVEAGLGFQHRTAGHSLPWMGSLYATARVAKESGLDRARRLCEKIGAPEYVDAVVDALDDLVSWVLNGGLAGVATHWLGDVPTSGSGGTALTLLAPLVGTNFNLDLILSADPVLNQGALYLGGVLAAASWLSVSLYMVLPERSIDRIERKLSDFLEWISDTLPSRDQLYSRGQKLYERILSSLRNIATWQATPGPATHSLVTYAESSPACETALVAKNTSKRPKNVELQPKRESKRQNTEISLRTRPNPS